MKAAFLVAFAFALCFLRVGSQTPKTQTDTGTGRGTGREWGGQDRRGFPAGRPANRRGFSGGEATPVLAGQALRGLLVGRSRPGSGGGLGQVLRGLLGGHSTSGVGGGVGQVLQGLRRQQDRSELGGGFGRVLHGLLAEQSASGLGRVLQGLLRQQKQSGLGGGMAQVLQGLLGMQDSPSLGGDLGQVVQSLLGQQGGQGLDGGVGLVVRSLLREQSQAGVSGGLGQASQGLTGSRNSPTLGGDVGRGFGGLLGRQSRPGLDGGPGRTLQGLLGRRGGAGLGRGQRQGLRGLTAGPMTGLLGLSGQRRRFPGFPAGRGRVAVGARDGEASGGLWGFVPEGALQAAWTRTLAGRQVAESGWCWNNTHVAVAVVRSRDPQLTEVNFTAAATLYTFRQNDTIVAVRPGFRRVGTPCFLLPPDVVSFSQTQDTLSARNNTVVDVPSRVLRVKVKDTAGGLSPRQRADLLRDNPALLFFCGLGALVPVSVADEATFPTSDNTDAGRVFKMVTMDMELDILVPKTVGTGRFLGNGLLAAAGKSRGRMVPVLRG